ncbi:MarC family protein [Salaquimonas pukyongi]|uniref:MarC family protein n=1 Tax=Salaquimonas pukyongi TaxID=2712698 RepID=UPI00096B8EA1|nr:MarC family protein [Salaquimonas pukyongi]
MLDFDIILNAFVTLAVTIDPPGLAPIFLALTSGMNRTQRYSVALRSVAIAFGVLVAFALAGIVVLDTMGITIHAFRVAGGLLLFYIAIEMVFEKRQERHEKSSQTAITKDQIANIAAFPLAIPLIAGPGAISATILLATDLGHEWQPTMLLLGVIVLVLLLVLLAFVAAEFLDKYLGATGRTILTRLLGVLLAALAVQFVADGALALFAG